jgi:hypothetical protein
MLLTRICATANTICRQGSDRRVKSIVLILVRDKFIFAVRQWKKRVLLPSGNERLDEFELRWQADFPFCSAKGERAFTRREKRDSTQLPDHDELHLPFNDALYEIDNVSFIKRTRRRSQYRLHHRGPLIVTTTLRRHFRYWMYWSFVQFSFSSSTLVTNSDLTLVLSVVACTEKQMSVLCRYHIWSVLFSWTSCAVHLSSFSL